VGIGLSFSECAERWFIEADVSDATKKLRRSYYNRDIYPAFKGCLLSDITETDVRGLCNGVKARGAPGTAVQILGIIRSIYTFALLKGYKGANPARFVPNASIAKFKPRIRVLAADELRDLYSLIADPQIKVHHQLAIRLLLLTLARRGELLLARWPEIDFKQRVWSVPPGRAKVTRARRVHLSTQAIDVLIHLKALAGESDYLFPSPIDSFSPMAATSLDACTKAICRRARARDLSLRDFAPSDLRSTGEGNLKQLGFEIEWIEVVMAREEVMRRHRIVDLDRYDDALRHLMQQWANIIEAWVAGVDYRYVLVPCVIQFSKTRMRLEWPSSA
jgi:integrase